MIKRLEIQSFINPTNYFINMDMIIKKNLEKIDKLQKRIEIHIKKMNDNAKLEDEYFDQYMGYIENGFFPAKIYKDYERKKNYHYRKILILKIDLENMEKKFITTKGLSVVI